MPLPGEQLSAAELQNLSNKVISEVFGHSPQDTTNLPGETVSNIGISYFTQDPSALSHADYAGLQKSFPGSPITNSPDASIKLTPKDIRTQFVNLVLRGPVSDVSDGKYHAVAGYNFTFFNRDYWMNGAPTYDAINAKLRADWKRKEYRAGDPGNAFMPNPISVPGGEIEGYGALSDNGRPPIQIVDMETPAYGSSTFVGVGTALSPGKSSERISKRTELILGKSSLE